METERTKSTSASRMKKMRAKQKANDPEGFLQREKTRIADLRKKQREHMSNKEKEEKKRYERERKQLQRAKKRIENKTPNRSGSDCSSNTSTPYRCKQTYSKAVLKGVRALPHSPRKRKVIVQGLAKRFGIELSENVATNLNFDEEIKTDYKTVQDFYFRPDIVYTCPGMKDVITVWHNGKKEQLQKHFMTMFLREAFYIFKEQHKDIKIGFSKFCSLRPKNVLLLKETPSEQCKCKIHENFILKLKSLKMQYNNEFWSSVLCDNHINSSCWQNSCEKCSGGKLVPLPENPDIEITWKEWLKNEEGRMKLWLKENSAMLVYEKLIEDFPKMLAHVNTKRIQHDEFDSDKKSASRILQIDFAMSFSCEYQNEIQSALWSRSSVLLFTAAVFCGESCKTYVICSDTKNKDKDTVFVFLDFFYSEIIKADPEIFEEVIWSDGPSSEFKNKFMVKTLQLLSKKHERTFTWKYFATSHGKGVVDGVGGNIKRLVRMKMMAQGEHDSPIQSAKDFAAVAAELNTKTEVWYLGADHIQDEVINQKPWDGVKAVPGISGFHVIQCKNGVIHSKANALSTSAEMFSKRNSIDLVPGNWVVVTYEGKEYPGEVKIVEKEFVKVSVMVPTGPPNHFKWPQSPDSIFYPLEDVLRKTEPPVVVNSRGLYKFVNM